MKIKSLTVKNYRGFQSEFTLNADGKNVLIIGENGSGKTSLMRALDDILRSSRSQVVYQKNIFMEEMDGEIRLVLNDESASTYILKSDGISTAINDGILTDAAKSKRFLEYKGLLKTYLLDGQRVNLFALLVEDILADVINPMTMNSFGDDWANLQKSIPPKPKRSFTLLYESINKFSQGLLTVLQDIKREALQMLGKFDPYLDFDFSNPIIQFDTRTRAFIEPTVWLTAKFRGREVQFHHTILNEARLSAIAICLYFATALRTPPSELRILALDDVLIGLDMDNRLPLLDILRMPEFKDHQIFLLTYDPVWFDLVQARVDKREWRFFRMFVPRGVHSESPVIEDEDLLVRAKQHYEAKDFKAAAVYARSAFERMLQRFCESKKIKVRFVRQLKALDTNDLLLAVYDWKDPSTKQPMITNELKQDIDRVRSIVLNPLSHAQLDRITDLEVLDAIRVVQLLECKLSV